MAEELGYVSSPSLSGVDLSSCFAVCGYRSRTKQGELLLLCRTYTNLSSVAYMGGRPDVQSMRLQRLPSRLFAKSL